MVKKKSVSSGAMNTSDAKSEATIIGFNDKWIMLLGIPLLGSIMPFIFFSACRNAPISESYISITTSIINTFIFWQIDKKIIIYFRKKFPKHKDYIKRLTYQLVVLAITTYLLLIIIIWALGYLPHEPHVASPTHTEAIAGTYTITALVLAIYEAMYFFDLWKIEILENEKLKTENTKAQLEVLKNQVNPHFLFNSFNTLVAIIPDSPEIAVKFTTELSNFYRYILAFKDKELIPVQQELNSIDSYIYLLKIRFQDNLVIEKGEDFPSEMYMPPLSLQILVENAVKHNIVSKSKPLTISITYENNQICVANNYQPKQEAPSTQTGLKNIAKRYELITHESISITNTRHLFKVCLPLIHVKSL